MHVNLHLREVFRLGNFDALILDLGKQFCAARFHFEQVPSLRRFWDAKRRAVGMSFKMSVAVDDFKLIAVRIKLVNLAADAAQFLNESQLFLVSTIKKAK